MSMSALREFFRSETWQKLRDVARPEDDAVLGGVCTAFGRATPFAAWMWRALFCTTALLWGFGIGAYVILWISIPEDRS